MHALRIFFLCFTICILSSTYSIASIQLFKVEMDFDEENETLTVALLQDVELGFTDDVVANFVLVLRGAFNSTPGTGFTTEASAFTYERNGEEVLPSGDQKEMGHLSSELEAIQPNDFFFEIGEVEFANGDRFTITASAVASLSSWSGSIPDSGPVFDAFLADTEGLPINQIIVIPERNSFALSMAVFCLSMLWIRRRGWRLYQGV